MDSNEQIKNKLDSIYISLNENNELLKGLLWRTKVTNMIMIVKWVIILGITFSSFYFLQPLVSQFKGVYSNGILQDGLKTLKDLQGLTQ